MGQTASALWSPLGDAPWPERDYHAGVVLPDGRFIVCGGRTGFRGGRYERTNDVWVLDPDTGHWQDLGEAPWRPRSGHVAALLPDGRLAICGGEEGGGQRFRDVWALTLGAAQAEWEDLGEAPWGARSGHAAALLPDGRLVVCGGYGRREACLRDVWAFTASTGRWEALDDAPWTARFGHTATMLSDGRLVVCGGRGAGDDMYLSDTWTLSPAAMQWESLGQAQWPKRSGHAAVGLPDGRLLIMGGWAGNGGMADTWALTPSSGRWEALGEASWTKRFGLRAVTLADGRVLIFGGYGFGGWCRDMWVFTQPLRVVVTGAGLSIADADQAVITLAKEGCTSLETLASLSDESLRKVGLGVGHVARLRHILRMRQQQLGPVMVAQRVPRLSLAVQHVDKAAVAALFRRSSGAGYSLSRVELVVNERLVRMASDMLDNLDNRRTGPLTGIFHARMPDGLMDDELAAKNELLSFLKGEFVTKEWAGVGLGHANVLPVWHGARAEALDSIAETGFAVLVNHDDKDPGFHANGRYNTVQSELACLYASDYPEPKDPNMLGEYVVLLSAAVVGVAYPITPCTFDYPKGDLPPTRPDQCRFYGGSFFKPCDTHVIAVQGGNAEGRPSSDMLATYPKDATFHELVSAQDAQLLPMAKVFFRKQHKPLY